MLSEPYLFQLGELEIFVRLSWQEACPRRRDVRRRL